MPLRSMAFAVAIANFVGFNGAGTAVLTASTFGHFFFAGQSPDETVATVTMA